MNNERLATEFWRNGYLVFDGFFDAALMDSYHALILEHYGENPGFAHDDAFLEKSATEVIPWFPQRDGFDEFDVVENDPRLSALTSAILGAGWVPHYSMVMYSKHGTRGQAWHQDCPPEDPQRFNLNRLVYTSDVPPGHGGQTIIVPGSHRYGLLPAGEPDCRFDGEIALSPEKGTLILIHGHCWHSVTPVATSHRVSTNYRCGPAGTTESMTDVCVYRNMRYRFSTQSVIEDRLDQAGQ